MCRSKWGKVKKTLMRGINQDLVEMINKGLVIHLFFHSINMYSAPETHQAPRLSIGDTP